MKQKKTFETLSTKFASSRAKIAGLATTVMMVTPMIANADWSDGNADAGNIVVQIADIVVNIFPFIGVFFVLAGVFKLIMAYRSNQPEEQSTAAKDIVIGAVFLAFRIFIWSSLRAAIF